MSLLKVENLTKRFGGNVANSNVSFSVEKNQIVGIIGPNGAGKTTTFNLISGFLSPTEGKVIFDGHDITNKKAHQIAALGMVRTFQHTSVFSDLTVFENILTAQHLEASKLLKIALINPKKYKQEENKFKERANEILELMEMTDKKDLVANTLPYGDQRKLEIAIALAANPKLLLLDEPAAGMNDAESAKFVEIVKHLRKQGITILIVEHDMKVVMNLCDHIIVLDHGKKIFEGDPEAVSKNEKVLEVYLGKMEDEHDFAEQRGS